MNNSKIENLLMEQRLNEELEAENQQVSQPNANTNVSGSQSHSMSPKTVIVPDGLLSILFDDKTQVLISSQALKEALSDMCYKYGGITYSFGQNHDKLS